MNDPIHTCPHCGNEMCCSGLKDEIESVPASTPPGDSFRHEPKETSDETRARG